jgi:hypothetical protein
MPQYRVTSDTGRTLYVSRPTAAAAEAAARDVILLDEPEGNFDIDRIELLPEGEDEC